MKRKLKPNLVTLLVAAGLVPGAASAADARVTFDRHEVDLGRAQSQTVVTGFFLDARDPAMADLAVVHLDPSGEPRLRIYSLDEPTSAPELETSLGRDIVLVDVARIGGRDRLITYADRMIRWFDPAAARERELLEVPASFRSIDPAKIPAVDITRDLNGDGLDDLVMPQVDGFWISTQTNEGTFTEPVKLGPAEPFADHDIGHFDVDEPRPDKDDGGRTYGEVGITRATLPIYLGRLHQTDYDLDGRRDLVFWNEDHFDLYLQDENGRFDPEMMTTFTTQVLFSLDQVYARMFEFNRDSLFKMFVGTGKTTKETVLDSFHDVDGDGVDDMVTLTLWGPTATKLRSRYQVHLGASSDGGTVFAPEPALVIRPGGKAGGLMPWGYATQSFEDLDGDGRLEMAYRYVNVGLGGIARVMASRSPALDVELFHLEDGGTPIRPATKRKLRRFAPFGKFFFPPVLLGDLDGDGRSDLVAGKNPRELEIFLGVPGPEFLTRQSQAIEIALPADERNVWLRDLNRDGKEDVVVLTTPAERNSKAPCRITALITR